MLLKEASVEVKEISWHSSCFESVEVKEISWHSSCFESKAEGSSAGRALSLLQARVKVPLGDDLLLLSCSTMVESGW